LKQTPRLLWRSKASARQSCFPASDPLAGQPGLVDMALFLWLNVKVHKATN
jgi:hypothetical protein